MTNESRRPSRFAQIFIRTTSSGNFLPEIDGLRFIAIASVVLFHIYMMVHITHPGASLAKQVLKAILGNGGRGVPLFFCISGFILGLPFARHHLADGPPVSLKKYYLRRVTRLEPPYLLNLLFRLPFVPAAKSMSMAQVLPHFAASLAYAHGLIYQAWPLVHPPSWSLEVEVQFYLIAPLLAAGFYWQRARFRYLHYPVVLGLIATVQLLLNFDQTSVPNTRLLLSIANYVQFFVVGIFLADIFVAMPGKLVKSRGWDLVAVTSLILFFYLDDRLTRTLSPGIAALILISAFKGPIFNRVLSTPAVFVVGGMCYSLYLTHSFVLQVVFEAIRRLHLDGSVLRSFVMGCTISLPAILATGSLYFLAIEKPCMDKEWPKKLRNRIWNKARPTV